MAAGILLLEDIDNVDAAIGVKAEAAKNVKNVTQHVERVESGVLSATARQPGSPAASRLHKPPQASSSRGRGRAAGCWAALRSQGEGSGHSDRDGGLRRRRQSGPFVTFNTQVTLDGLLNALEYMHTVVRAIHRDIKAANVLLTADAKVKLADLGVAAQVLLPLPPGAYPPPLPPGAYAPPSVSRRSSTTRCRSAAR